MLTHVFSFDLFWFFAGVRGGGWAFNIDGTCYSTNRVKLKFPYKSKHFFIYN